MVANSDPLDAARGVIHGMLLALAFWGVVALVVYLGGCLAR